jgi:hypothetical protein
MRLDESTVTLNALAYTDSSVHINLPVQCGVSSPLRLWAVAM